MSSPGSQIPAFPLGFGQFARGQYAPLSKERPKPLTWSGVAFFLVALSVSMSGYMASRLEVGALHVHLYFLLMGPLFAFVVLRRLGDFPRAALYSLIILTLFIIAATTMSPGWMDESAKVVGGLATLVTAALIVRSDKDFRLAALGLILAISFLCIRALITKHDSFNGANPLEGTNENAFSLYTLGPLLLCGYLAFDRGAAIWTRVFVSMAILLILVTTFSNANRSGWLGAIFALIQVGIVVMLNRGYRLRSIVLVAALVAGSLYAVLSFADLALVKYRYEESFTGHTADQLRIQLFLGAMSLGLKNPILGVSPQSLEFELSRELTADVAIDVHNIFGYIVGGCGLITAAVFVYLAWTLFRRPPHTSAMRNLIRGTAAIGPHQLLRMVLLLWALRGLFSREILYAPGFCITLGLVIGLCIVRGVWTMEPRRPSFAGASIRR